MQNNLQNTAEETQDLQIKQQSLEATDDMDEFVAEMNGSSSIVDDVNGKISAIMKETDSLKNGYDDAQINDESATNAGLTEVSQENSDLGTPNNSASNLTPLMKGVESVYVPHPLLQKFPPMKESERISVDMNMDRYKKMLDPALVYGNYLLSNVYQYEKAVELGYEVKLLAWEGNENDLEALLEEIAFFKTAPNSTQRAIWAYLHLEKFKKDAEINVVKRRRKGGKANNVKFDARSEPARLYNTSIGYISKAGIFDRDHHELFEKCFAGDFEFQDADRIVNVKKLNPEFYSDLLSKVIPVKEINKYKRYLSEDNTLYKMLRSGEIGFEEASKLLEIQNYNQTTFEQFVSGELLIVDIDSTLLHLKNEYAKSNDDEDGIKLGCEGENGNSSTIEIKEIDTVSEPADNIKPEMVLNLVLSPKVRNRLIDLAASQHKSADEFLAELLDLYQGNKDSETDQNGGVK